MGVDASVGVMHAMCTPSCGRLTCKSRLPIVSSFARHCLSVVCSHHAQCCNCVWSSAPGNVVSGIQLAKATVHSLVCILWSFCALKLREVAPGFLHAQVHENGVDNKGQEVGRGWGCE